MPTIPAAPAIESRPAPEDVPSLRSARDDLCRLVLEGGLRAGDFPAVYSAHADRFLEGLLTRATEGRTRGYALLAVGGYGRHQLAPGSDLDLVLLHRGRRRYKDVSERLWYAIWDEGLRLDHSVRTRNEALTVARADLKVILGLLDARVVAGDPAVAERLLEDARALWRQDTGKLRQLSTAMRGRHEEAGELAFLLEPDLKQSAGGLRDLAALRAVNLALAPLPSRSDLEALQEAEGVVLAARVALQCRTGGTSDRLALQEQDQVASLLGVADADVLMAHLAEAGRTISASCAEAWHRARALLGNGSSASGELLVERSIVIRDGEIGLAADVDPSDDPALALRLARVAAERHLFIEQESLDKLTGVARHPPEPWSDELRETFVGLLSTGVALVPAVEALDRRRLFELYLPEWRAVRNKPQRNAYHRYTVDRHLLEAVARTAPHLGEVDRPDLLVLGALLHDLGKGFPGDHSAVGRELAENIGRRMGLEEQDVATLMKVVAYHLVLPEFATRRDLDDPSTARVVARLVEDKRTLSLLAALTEADSRATGSSAWSPWKAELVRTLVARVGDVLDGRPLPAPTPPSPPEGLVAAIAAGRLALEASGRKLTVVAPDRPGLLAAVTGVLALHGCNVLRATVGAGGPRMAVESFDIAPVFDRSPDWARIEEDIAAALSGELNLEEALASQEKTYARGRRPYAALAPLVAVHIDELTSQLATIVEVRAPDRLGILHHITAALASNGLDVVAALVDTLGHEVVDAFYLRDRRGMLLGATPGRTEEVRALLLEVLERVC